MCQRPCEGESKLRIGHLKGFFQNNSYSRSHYSEILFIFYTLYSYFIFIIFYERLKTCGLLKNNTKKLAKNLELAFYRYLIQEVSKF